MNRESTAAAFGTKSREAFGVRGFSTAFHFARSDRTQAKNAHQSTHPKRFARIVCNVLVVAFVLFLAGCGKSDHSAAKGPAKYYCPMHPTYTSDRPGDCPICNMKLVPIGESLVETGQNIAGRIAIAISPEKRQAIGLTTSPVEHRDLSQTIHATAAVTHDETRFSRIAPRFSGWVRKLNVNYTGQHLLEGEPLFTVYSPELFATENEYLLALRNYHQATNSPAPQVESAKHLFDSAKRRLELLGVGEEEIRSLETRGQATEELVIRTPVSGHVVTKNAVEGKSFMAGDTLYEIADLSRVWLIASVFEYELPLIKTGQKAHALFPNLGNREYESEVTFIYPHLDPQTRRAEIRLELDNPGHVLRPGMWASVTVDVKTGEALSVPASAVIDTGSRQIAFAASSDDHLEPREVKIGVKTDDYYEVLEGLKEGEQVVTRALFLVDSESQLKAAISGMGSTGEHKH